MSIVIFNHIGYAEKTAYTFDIPTLKRSYYVLGEESRIKHNNGVPITRDSGINVFINTSFSSADTAFFVIDPQDDSPSDFLNQYYGQVTNQYILPLIKKAQLRNFPIFIFTNNYKVLSHLCSISKPLIDLSDSTNVKIVFWQDILKYQKFSKSLRQKGIKEIIYTGIGILAIMATSSHSVNGI
ncbi:MAG: hypothetical protein AB8B66_00270 [Rickettsiaceae bacterium]